MGSSAIKQITIVACIILVLMVATSCSNNDRSFVRIENGTVAINTLQIPENESPDRFLNTFHKVLSGQSFHSVEISFTRHLEEILEGLTRYSSQIEEMTVSGITPNMCDSLSQFCNLSSLTVRNSDLYGLREMPNLLILEINNTRANLEGFPNLRKLTISTDQSERDINSYASGIVTLLYLEELNYEINRPMNEIHNESFYMSQFARACYNLKSLQIVNGVPVSESPLILAGESEQRRVDATDFVKDIEHVTSENYRHVDEYPFISGRILVGRGGLAPDDPSFNIVYFHQARNMLTFNFSEGRLPDELFASNSEECETLILLSSKSFEYGVYTDGSTAYIVRYYATVYHIRSGLVFAPVEYAVTFPPITKPQNEPGVGHLDPNKFFEFISTLKVE